MNLLFYFGHPSQYLFLKNAIRTLRNKGNNCDIYIKSKDVLEQLMIEAGETYRNILPEGRDSKNLGLFKGLIKREIRLQKYLRHNKYDILIGTDPCLAHLGFLNRIKVITTLEDDIGVIPRLATLTFPFTNTILTPEVCDTGQFNKKTIRYRGFMKLGYLHKNYFTREAPKLHSPYSIIRLSKLDAHHDRNTKGLNNELLASVIACLKQYGNLYITSEGNIDDTLKQYELKIPASDMHQVLSHASLLVSDSQSMSMEAAMLGVPSIRFSGFVGKISVLEELEVRYGLTFGIRPETPDLVLKKIDDILFSAGFINEFKIRHRHMLDDQIDVTAFLVWFIETYPGSVRILKEDPAYQEKFR